MMAAVRKFGCGEIFTIVLIVYFHFDISYTLFPLKVKTYPIPNQPLKFKRKYYLLLQDVILKMHDPLTKERTQL